MAGFTVVESSVVAYRSTVAEKRAWLSIPLFARPDGGFTYQQRMDILERAYAEVDPR
ncbi:hypothetical protein ACFV0L_28265 [Streptosporangium canum]|uniref:hypothetical protein n=1 Tax=Streptosporangium canum TaxID=324952 RepID=UPI003691C2C8